MGQLIVTEFVTLDGVAEAPGGGDHPHAGWTFKDVPFNLAAYELKGREQEEAAALLVGRRSWQDFHPVWPTMDEFARYNALPKYVVSTTLTDADVAATSWQPMTLLRSLDDIARVKDATDGQLQVHGSLTLAQNLAAADLVDRYHLLVFPLLLGSGKRLFADDAEKQKLSLVSSRSFDNRITELILDVQGNEGNAS